MHDQTSDISHCLSSCSEHHQTSIEPRLVANGKHEIDEREDAKVGAEESVDSQTRSVTIDGLVHGAFRCNFITRIERLFSVFRHDDWLSFLFFGRERGDIPKKKIT